MYRRRGSSPPGELASPTLPEVVLSVVADTILDWESYAGPAPFNWQIWQAGLLFDATPGTDNNYGPVAPGLPYFILGVDSIGNPFTQQSNIVTV